MGLVLWIKWLPSHETAVDIDDFCITKPVVVALQPIHRRSETERETDNTVRNDFIYYQIITNDSWKTKYGQIWMPFRQ